MTEKLDKIHIDKNTIYMKKPSSWWQEGWREGLACGNGHIGALVYGGIKDRVLMVGSSTMWHGGKSMDLPDVHEALQETRCLMDQEQWLEASWNLTNHLKKYNYSSELEHPLPVADLREKITPIGSFHSYKRAVQMDTGEISSEWYSDNHYFRSDTFVSRNNGCIYHRVRSDGEVLDMELSLAMHESTGKVLPDFCDHIVKTSETVREKDCLIYSAQNDDGTFYGIVVRILSDGKMEPHFNGYHIKEASEMIAVILEFEGQLDRESAIVESIKLCAEANGLYEEELLLSSREHKSLYESAAIELFHEGHHSNEELLDRAFEGAQEVELIEKLWKYGRYLFICGTKEEGIPFSLYGLWCGDYNAKWPHLMANENLQMTYWHCFTGNLLEQHKCVLQYFNERIPYFKDNAGKLFGLHGIYMTSGTTPGVAYPTQVVPVIMNWVGASGWVAQHYVKYFKYRYGGLKQIDREGIDEFRTLIYPFLDETARFYEEYIRYYEDGSIKFYPSVSPENSPENFIPEVPVPHPMPTTINSTIDLAITKELFTNLLKLSEIMQASEERTGLWNKILSGIGKYAVNEEGAVREWQDKRFQDRYAHRHLSHVYPVFPGNEINTIDDTRSMQAFKTAVRLRKIDAQTGWSMAHMAAIYARFDDGEAALNCLDNLAKSCLLPNLFTVHNDWRGMGITLSLGGDGAPIQLDAILGYTNALQEMLLYADDRLIKLLPALPERIRRGKVRGFRFVQGTADMEWDLDARQFRIKLYNLLGSEFRVILPKYTDTYKLTAEGCEVQAVDAVSYVVKAVRPGGSLIIRA